MSADHHADAGTWVGRSIRRLEDRALVRGEGRFTGDQKAEVALRFLRSPVAAGRIARIEMPKHLGEGVRILTASDLASIARIRPMLHRPDYVAVSQSVLADGVVRFVGEPIAAVIAPTPAMAEDVVDAIEIDIEETTPVVDVLEALKPGTPLVHEGTQHNVLVEGRIRTPGFDEVMGSAAHVVEIELTSRRQNATPMEGRAAHASFDARSGRIRLTCSTQVPHIIRTAVAELIGMPEADLHVVAPDVGGGFGQKMMLPAEYVLVAYVCRMLKKSVSWIEDRRENLTSSFHARDMRIKLKGAFDASAKLVAVEGEMASNVGAYSGFPITCGVEALMGMAELPGPYDVQQYGCVSRGVATNTCTMAPYRGVSRPVITFAMERLMDTAARRLAVDPVDIRRRNLIDSFPYTSATGLVFDPGTYREVMEIAVRELPLGELRIRQTEMRKQGRYLGVGFSTFSERTGYGTPAFAARGMEITPGYEIVDISMDPSGNVTARIGAFPHGQGLKTTLAQIIADQLGVAPQQVTVTAGDTDQTPYGWGTFASRSLVIAGGACLVGARKLRTKLIRIAAHLMKVAPEAVSIEQGFAKATATNQSLPIPEIARTAYHKAHLLYGVVEAGLSETGFYDPPGTFSNACHVAVVEVDIETGGVRLDRFMVVEDAGRLINPMIVDGQIHGGVAQGIANALLEEIVYDERGNILTATLADFLPPTCAELPSFELHHIETYSDATITEAKGIGEGGAIGAPAAVVNAVSDALSPFGIEFYEMPVTPQRIRAALRAAGVGGPERVGA
ncbi:MAG: xanthine dehydrogenase family protein molybdopterin-binding subunit [Hyphomicrobiaceae bacterium]